MTTNDNGTLIACAAWGDWHPGVPEGMVVVSATPGGSLGAEGRRHFAAPAAEYASRGESRFAVDPKRHAEVFGFQGTGSAKASPALERTAAESRLGMLMQKYGTGRASAADPANELGKAKPWGEILQKLGYAKPAGSPGGATVGNLQSPTRTASSPARPEPEQTATGGRALPWKEILAKLDAEERR